MTVKKRSLLDSAYHALLKARQLRSQHGCDTGSFLYQQALREAARYRRFLFLAHFGTVTH